MAWITFNDGSRRELTTDEKRAGEMAVRSMSARAREFYANSDYDVYELSCDGRLAFFPRGSSASEELDVRNANVVDDIFCELWADMFDPDED